MSRAWRAVARGAAAMAVVATAIAPASGAQAPVAPGSAIAAARAARADSVGGASLRVVVLTVGVGEQVWERFGHNLLWIHDDRTGESIAWNWGLFDFDEPGFYQRFLLGETRYWMEGHDVAAVLAMYERHGREVVAQELTLTAGQRAALDALVRENATEANRFYRYDYYLDNCSTRLRDALDIVLDGALRRAFDVDQLPGVTYRTESLRLVEPDAALVLGMDVALGVRADRDLTAWQASFVPMRFRDALRSVTVPGADGVARPLVAREYVVVPATRAPEPPVFAPSRYALRVGLAALALSTVIIVAGIAARRGARVGRMVAIAIGVVIHLAAGVVAVVLCLAWFATRHEFWGWNPHLLLVTPVSLVVAALLPRAAGRAGWVRGYHLVLCVVAAIVALVAAVRLAGGHAGASLLAVWANAAWILQFTLFAVLWGVRSRPDPQPPLPAAEARAAA